MGFSGCQLINTNIEYAQTGILSYHSYSYLNGVNIKNCNRGLGNTESGGLLNLKNCILSGNNVGIYWYRNPSLDLLDISISNSQIVNNNIGMKLGQHILLDMVQCKISNNYDIGILTSSEFEFINPNTSTIRVNYSYFDSSSTYLFDNQGIYQRDMRFNYWGDFTTAEI